jgi:hypothetical protein
MFGTAVLITCAASLAWVESKRVSLSWKERHDAQVRSPTNTSPTTNTSKAIRLAANCLTPAIADGVEEADFSEANFRGGA